MSRAALLLVLVSCVTHAAWNLLAKRSSKNGAFFWLASAVVVVVGLPVFWLAGGGAVTGAPRALWVCVVLTGIWQAAYYFFLATAYRHGDLSLVYPLARSAPLFVVPLAGWISHQWPSPIAALGLVFVVAGTLVLTRTQTPGSNRGWRDYAGPASLWALATAVASAAYTVTDDIGMDAVAPIASGIRGAFFYGYLEWVSTTLWLLAPVLAQTGARGIARIWNRERGAVATVGLLTFGTYLLVLWAYALSTKVAYVAGFRQLSIVLAVLGGIYLLKEPGGARRIGSALVITVGLALIAVAR